MGDRIFAGVACGRFPATCQFFDSFYGMILPEGSARQRIIGANYPRGQNELIRQAQDGKFDYLLYVDDDFLFPPNMAMKLLSHNKDCVSALSVQRLPPFRPAIFNSVDDKGFLGYHPLTTETGLLRVLSAGGLPTLTKLSVFDKLSKPYVPYNSIVDGIDWGCDILLAKKMIEAGIETYIDLDIQIWHSGNYSVTSRPNEQGIWETKLQIGQAIISLPAVK